MSIDTLTTWQATFDALPRVSVWQDNFATWVDDRVTSKMELPGLTPSTALTFTFSKSTFKAALDLLSNTSDKSAAIMDFADAWGSAVSASGRIVPAGTSIGTPAPTTTWSLVSSAVIDASSILSGKAKIFELASEPNSATSKFPEKFREAFLLLTITTSGLDSTPGGAGGPLPLVDPARSVA